MYHSNAKSNRVIWRMDRCSFSVDNDFAFVRSMQPINEIHQGAFACAILSKQGMDFTFTKIEIDIVICKYTRKLLGDTLHFKYDIVGLGHGKLYFSYGTPSAAGGVVLPITPVRMIMVRIYGVSPTI